MASKDERELRFKTDKEGQKVLDEILTEENAEAITEELTEDQKQQAVIEERKRKFPRPPQRSGYFGQPVNWQKGAGVMVHMQEDINKYQQQVFHKTALKEVRKALGSKCRHLAHVKDVNGNVFVQAKLDIDGKITTFNVEMDSPNPDNWEAETYKSLNDTLKKYLNNVTRG